MSTFGASPSEWEHFSLLLGLTPDLLPVVSNANAARSTESSVKALGKVPSIYNVNGLAIGLTGWTTNNTSERDIKKWSRQKDYGLCVRTNLVRAIDVDITEPESAQSVARFIQEHLRMLLPRRERCDSSKFLLAFKLPGDLPKRSFRTTFGIVEFLGSGQHFVACGTHKDGARYEWAGGLPDIIPDLTLAQFDSLWSALVYQYASEPPTSQKLSTRSQTLASAAQADPVARYLSDNGFVKSTERDGRMHVTCPWGDEHTSESSDSATSYFPAHTGGFDIGHFKCLHAHCDRRTRSAFLNKIGFDALSFDNLPPSGTPSRFALQSVADFIDAPPLDWLIKGVLPRAEMGVVFGASGSGKTFFVLDLVAAIARGVAWRGKRVKQGSVVYVAAEGAHGFRSRLKAYLQHHALAPDALDINVISDAPALMSADDTRDVLRSIGDLAPSVIVIDTLARTLTGGDENNGKDVSMLLNNCSAIHKRTGALILLVHHSGKDASKGARGWSGIRAAMDVQIEVQNTPGGRVALMDKLKDGAEGAEYGFKLDRVVLGQDADGDDVTSCVVSECAAPLRGKNGKVNADNSVL